MSYEINLYGYIIILLVRFYILYFQIIIYNYIMKQLQSKGDLFMYFETYEKLKQYAILYPDNIESLTQTTLDKMKLKEGKLIPQEPVSDCIPCTKYDSD